MSKKRLAELRHDIGVRRDETKETSRAYDVTGRLTGIRAVNVERGAFLPLASMFAKVGIGMDAGRFSRPRLIVDPRSNIQMQASAIQIEKAFLAAG